MGISQYRLAKEIDVPAQRIGDIVMGKRAIMADTEVAERQLGSRLGNIRPWTLAIREPTRKSRVRARK